MSGEGPEQGLIIVVYYEPAHERKVLQSWKKEGIDLAKNEAVPVDPEDCADEEWYFIYWEGEIMFIAQEEYILSTTVEGVGDPGTVTNVKEIQE